MLKLIKKFQADNNGATVIEYALIAGIISVSVIAGAGQMGNTVSNVFQDHADVINEANDKY